MRTALYARISKADDELGVDRQLMFGHQRAEAEGWTVTGEYVDNNKRAYTGSKPREQYERLLADVAAGGVDQVWVAEFERIHRSPKELLRLDEVLKAGHVKWVRTGRVGEENDERVGTAAGDRAIRDRGSAAIYESQLKGERNKRKVVELKEGGFHTGGAYPFGFEGVREQGGVRLRVRTDQATALRRVYGDLLNGTSLRSCVRWLNAQGFRTAHGKEFYPSTLRQTLLAERNAGAVVDRRTWREAGDLLQHAGRVQPRGGRYLLTGLLFCAEHDRPLSGRPVGGKRRYICANGSVHLGITAEPLERYLLSARHEWRLEGERVEVADPLTVDPALRQELDELEHRLEGWAREAAEAGLSASEIRAGRDPLLAHRVELEEQLAGETRQHRVRTELREWLEAGMPESTEAEQRAVLEELITRVNVRPTPRRGSRHVEVKDRIEVVWRT